MIAGTIRNAVNQMQLVNDWEQKKATGDVVKKQEGMTVTSQEESMIQHFREQLERDKESSAYSQIYNKIASGQELTASEEDAIPVSYTHLDVYKRQGYRRWITIIFQTVIWQIWTVMRKKLPRRF